MYQRAKRMFVRKHKIKGSRQTYQSGPSHILLADNSAESFSLTVVQAHAPLLPGPLFALLPAFARVTTHGTARSTDSNSIYVVEIEGKGLPVCFFHYVVPYNLYVCEYRTRGLTGPVSIQFFIPCPCYGNVICWIVLFNLYPRLAVNGLGLAARFSH